MLGVGQRGLGDLAAEPLDRRQRRLEDLAHAGSIASRASSAGTPKRRPFRSSRLGDAHPALDPDRGRVAGVAALQRRQQQRRVGDVAGQRPALVERGGEGDHPVARDRAVGRLQADDPAERGGLADRAAGVGADRPGRQAAGDGRGRAARGAAGHPPAVPGVEHRPVGGVLVRGAHRELVHVGLAEHPGAGVARAAAPRSRCRAAGSPRGSASRPWSATPSVQKMSLTATGTPPSGPSPLPAQPGLPGSARQR